MAAGELAALMDMSPAAAMRLLDAGVALRLFLRKQTDGREPVYGLGVLVSLMVGHDA
jgi:hypothetical protein